MAKLLGLIGGLSWESTETYCRRLNAHANAALGGQHAATFMVYAMDFGEMMRLKEEDRWDEAADLLCQAALALERAGVDEILLCTNTMHRVAPQIESALSIPFLHIADATARHIARQGLGRVGLLGTRYTLEGDFYRTRMEERHGLSILVPEEEDVETLQRIIYTELVAGIIDAHSRQQFREIAARLVARGAEGIIFGCTEIGLLLSEKDVPVPSFDSALIHVDEAVGL